MIYMPKNHMKELYESKNPLVRYTHIKRLEKIKRMVTRTGRVLDAGCGEGQLLEILEREMPWNKYYGTDRTKTALNSAKKRTKAKLTMEDLRRTKFKSKYFDTIICTEVIEHIKEKEKALKEMKRILKDDGELIISFPNEKLWTIARFLLGRRPIKVVDHVNNITPEEIRKDTDMNIKEEENIPFNIGHKLSLTTILRVEKK